MNRIYRIYRNVVNIANGQVAVQCLMKPLGINTPQYQGQFTRQYITHQLLPNLLKLEGNGNESTNAGFWKLQHRY